MRMVWNRTNALPRVTIALTVVVAAVVATVVAMPAPAWAHTELLGTSPADAAVQTAPVEEVTLTFSGPVRADGSSVVVTGPDGQTHSQGALSVIDFVVHQAVADLASGTYRVDWVVVAGDGHPLSGQFTFQLSLPPELEPTPSPTAPSPTATSPAPPATDTTAPASDTAAGDGGGSAAWWWLIAALVAGLFVLVYLLTRRHSRGTG